MAEEKNNILIAEDDREIAGLIEIHLLGEGYGVYKAENGREALDVLRKREVHLVILDIMMPGMDGLETCRKIREEWNIPILMLSAKSEDIDKILGLSLGADDYMTKPFNPLELLARVKSQIRRYLYLNPDRTREPNTDIIAVRGLVIDQAKHRVKVDGREIVFTPTEYEIVLLLASNPGRVFNTEEIFERVWRERYFQSNNTVMVHVRKIREKLEENPAHPMIIKTVWGVGYKIEG